MSLTRRKWFLHRVLPVGAVLAAGGAGLGGAVPAFAGAEQSAFWDGPQTTQGAGSAAASGKSTGKPSPRKDSKTGVSVQLDPNLPAHPLVQYAAQVAPNRKLRVIVQKKSAGASGQAIAQSVGGTHLEEFSFIKSHLMEIPAKAALQLARHKDVFHVSVDAKMHYSAISTTNLAQPYPKLVNAASVWNSLTAPATGAGIGVAILDSGANKNHPALKGNVTTTIINPRSTGKVDANGHGTHVTGIITGTDTNFGGKYLGVAPDANVISVQIADDTGLSYESDLVRGLQWVGNNKATYNIRVVNLSINGSHPTSYLTSPLCGAAEVLWAKGIVVVVAAGNRGSDPAAVQYAPSCDPFVISVGALDDNGTLLGTDDSLAEFSSRGTTLDNIAKPDIVAPGRKIVSCLASTTCTLAQTFPDRISDNGLYLRLSGTSMAAPVVAGSIALLLQRYPNLTPNQVKYILKQTARTYTGQVGAAKLLDIAASITLAAAGSVPASTQTFQPNNSVASSATTAGNTSAYWDSAYWDSAYWDSAYWDSAYWDSAYWDSAAGFDASGYDAADYDTIAYD